MAVAFRSARSAIGSGSTLTILKPDNLLVGDVMVAVTSAADRTSAPPAGWTLLASLDQARREFWAKVATTADTTATDFTWGAIGSGSSGGISAYSGSSGWGVFSSVLNAASVNQTVPSVIVADHASMVIALLATVNNAIGTPQSGWVERFDQPAANCAYCSDKSFPPGGTGSSTIVLSSSQVAGVMAIELKPLPLSGIIISVSSMSAILVKPDEFAGGIRSITSSLTGSMSYRATLVGAMRAVSALTGAMTGIPALDFTVYDGYIDDGTDVVGYIYHDTDQSRATDQSLKLQPVRQDVGNNPAEIRPESGDLFAQADFSHGAGQEYFHHEGRDPRRFLRSEGFDISVPGRLTHLHGVVRISPSATIGDVVVANGFPFYADGSNLYIGNGSFPGSWVLDNWDAGEARNAITSLATSGRNLYLATSGTPGNGIHQRNAAGIWSHYINDTNSLGVSKIAWVKDRLMAVSGTAFYEITAGGALPTAIETMAPGWSATAIFEAGGFVYVCWVNYDGNISQINHYGLNTAGTAIEKKGSTPLPQGQFATAGRGYLNTIFIGVGRRNSDGGFDPVLYQGVADTTGIVNYVKIVEDKGSGSTDLAVGAIAPYGESILYGWSLRAGASTGTAREGLGIFHLGLDAYVHHLFTGSVASRKIISIATYRGRVLFSIEGVGLWYEDVDTYVATAELIPSVADWSNAGLKTWDRLEVSHRPLAAGERVTLEYTTTHPDEADWRSAINSSVFDSEGGNTTLSTAESRLFALRLRSFASPGLVTVPTPLGFAVRSNPTTAAPEYHLSRTVRLFPEDRKDDHGETLAQKPDAMKTHLESLAYRWVKLYEPDATWIARVESVSAVRPMQPMEQVTAGDERRSGYVMQLVLTGTRP